MPSMKNLAVMVAVSLAVIYASNKIAIVGKLAGK